MADETETETIHEDITETITFSEHNSDTSPDKNVVIPEPPAESQAAPAASTPTTTAAPADAAAAPVSPVSGTNPGTTADQAGAPDQADQPDYSAPTTAVEGQALLDHPAVGADALKLVNPDAYVPTAERTPLQVEQDQGFSGVHGDPAPNENYTVPGVLAAAPTPETDSAMAEEAAVNARTNLPAQAAAQEAQDAGNDLAAAVIRSQQPGPNSAEDQATMADATPTTDVQPVAAPVAPADVPPVDNPPESVPAQTEAAPADETSVAEAPAGG